MTVIHSTLGSSLPSGAIDNIAATYNVQNQQQLVLPISCYLIGYVIGPSLCGPLSENYGRKVIIFSGFIIYTLFSLACTLAPNWASFLFFRFVCGTAAAAPVGIVGGLFADIWHDARKRGVAMACFMAATTGGPIIAPALSGFIAENTSWRWVFGVGTLFAAVTLPLIAMMPETYTPVLLSRKAARLRRETGDQEIIAKTDLHKRSPREVITVVMTRPYRMLVQELIVSCVCVYCALAYAIFYMYFEAYPIIFQGPDSVYKFSPGIAGLTFLPIAIGAIICAPIFLWYDDYLAKAQARNAPWSQVEEYRRLPLACIGGPLYVVSLLWIGWSSKPDIHWICPVLSGITFGMGFLLIFMALLNYLTDAYETFAASAQGIASTCRSVCGALIPLASRKMFQSLGIAWACSLLAFLSLGVSLIPFLFIRYGETIRANSRFCLHLKALKAREAEQEALRKQEEEEELMSKRSQTINANIPHTIDETGIKLEV